MLDDEGACVGLRRTPLLLVTALKPTHCATALKVDQKPQNLAERREGAAVAVRSSASSAQTSNHTLCSTYFRAPGPVNSPRPSSCTPSRQSIARLIYFLYSSVPFLFGPENKLQKYLVQVRLDFPNMSLSRTIAFPSAKGQSDELFHKSASGDFCVRCSPELFPSSVPESCGSLFIFSTNRVSPEQAVH